MHQIDVKEEQNKCDILLPLGKVLKLKMKDRIFNFYKINHPTSACKFPCALDYK